MLTAEPAWRTFNQGPVGFPAVGTPASISINGAQAQMTAATSVQLTAMVAHDDGGVEWEASAGTVTPEGAGGHTSLYTAPSQPPAGGTVTIAARLRDDHAVSTSQAIAIAPTQLLAPAPAIPSVSVRVPSAGSSGYKAGLPSISSPRAMLFGRVLVMSAVPSAAGLVRLDAYLNRRRLGGCATQTPGARMVTCRVRLGRRVSLRAHIRVVASLRVGGLVVHSLLPAQRILPIPVR
jgi:hypothetical protein